MVAFQLKGLLEDLDLWSMLWKATRSKTTSPLISSLEVHTK